MQTVSNCNQDSACEDPRTPPIIHSERKDHPKHLLLSHSTTGSVLRPRKANIMEHLVHTEPLQYGPPTQKTLALLADLELKVRWQRRKESSRFTGKQCEESEWQERPAERKGTSASATSARLQTSYGTGNFHTVHSGSWQLHCSRCWGHILRTLSYPTHSPPRDHVGSHCSKSN